MYDSSVDISHEVSPERNIFSECRVLTPIFHSVVEV